MAASAEGFSPPAKRRRITMEEIENGLILLHLSCDAGTGTARDSHWKSAEHITDQSCIDALAVAFGKAASISTSAVRLDENSTEVGDGFVSFPDVVCPLPRSSRAAPVDPWMFGRSAPPWRAGGCPVSQSDRQAMDAQSDGGNSEAADAFSSFSCGPWRRPRSTRGAQERPWMIGLSVAPWRRGQSGVDGMDAKEVCSSIVPFTDLPALLKIRQAPPASAECKQFKLPQQRTAAMPKPHPPTPKSPPPSPPGNFAAPAIIWSEAPLPEVISAATDTMINFDDDDHV